LAVSSTCVLRCPMVEELRLVNKLKHRRRTLS
jgi:hypothetical protein